MFSDPWMQDQGFAAVAQQGGLRDLISRRFADGGVVCITAEETLSIAYARMRMYDVSQLPVTDGKRMVGILDESDLLLAASGDPQAFRHPVSRYMTSKLQTVAPQTSLSELLPILDAGRVAIVADESGFYGLITRVDVLNYLRRRQAAA
jgi:cystathionine beta-synthase